MVNRTLRPPPCADRFWMGLLGAVAILLSPAAAWAQAPSEVPNDSLFSRQWSLHNSQGPDIDALQAWQYHTSSTAILGVVDTGMDWQHPDLAPNVWQNLGEDADGDGRTIEFIDGAWQFDPDDLDGLDGDDWDSDPSTYVDDLIGWDFMDNDPYPEDLTGHGTHVAGIMAARGDNNIGTAGIVWEGQLMALRCGRDGMNPAAAHRAIRYAAQHGVRLLNNSWAFGLPAPELAEAAEAADILLVAAAGNDGRDNDGQVATYPASLPSDYVLAVAASTRTDALASSSNYGLQSVDLAAPSRDIWSTAPNVRYEPSSGTSMAAPHVTATAALLLAERPSLTALQIKTLLLASVDRVDSLRGLVLTGGRLNAGRAVEMAGSGLVAEPQRLDCGLSYPGTARTCMLRLHNMTDTPRTVAVASTHAAFEPAAATHTLAPQSTDSIHIRFQPAGDGTFEAKLQLSAAGWSWTVDVIGEAQSIPAARWSASEIAHRVGTPARPFGPDTSAYSDSVVLANDGVRPLTWEVTNRPPDWLAVQPMEGTLSPGDSAALRVSFDIVARPGADHLEHVILLRTNDPYNQTVELVAALNVEAPIWPVHHPGSAEWLDIDGDGRLDLALLGAIDPGVYASSELVVFRQQASGTFSWHGVVGESMIYRQAWGDYDRDGDLDPGMEIQQWDSETFFVAVGMTEAVESELIVYGFYDDPRPPTLRGLVGWQDVDADGDLDLLTDAGFLRTKEDGEFELRSIGSRYPDSRSAWGDYDRDGDPDLFVPRPSPDSTSLLYRNDEGAIFEQVSVDIPAVEQGRASWVDVDSDGWLDVVVAGHTATGARLAAYLNREGTGFEPGPALDLTEPPSNMDWGDYDNDGDPDALVSGTALAIYRQEAGQFEVAWSDSLLRKGGAHWGDYDDDGDLDFAYTGAEHHDTDPEYPVLFRNTHDRTNTLPPAPTGLFVVEAEDSTTFRWSPSSDAETPDSALTYNLHIGTTPGGNEIMTPHANVTTGRRYVVGPGNVGSDTSWTLNARLPRPYYWSVQAIDGGYGASSFTTTSRLATEHAPDGPASAALLPFYPHPATDVTTLIYTLPAPAPVRIAVFDVLGRRIRTLAEGYRTRGRHELHVDVSSLAPGIYFVTLHTPDDAATRVLVVEH